jgi:cytoskeleton protein RodZ
VGRLTRRRAEPSRSPRVSEAVPTATPAGESIATVLRGAREDLGRELGRVSTDLRIRKVYLQAIEDGRFDDLPGATYAVGFVRAYADYLGLESEEIVGRFKDEVESLNEQLQLVFPAPVPESKIPGGALLLVSALLVALAYGGWFYLSSSDRQLADWIPDVPERLQSLITDAPDSSAAAPEEPAEAQPAVSVEDTELQAAEIPPATSAPPTEESAGTPVATLQPGQTPDAEDALASQEPQEPQEMLDTLPAAGDVEQTGVAVPDPAVAAVPSDSAGEAAAGSASLSEIVQAASPEAPRSTELARDLSAPETVNVAAGSTASAANSIPQAPSPEGLLPEIEAREPRVYGSENAVARIVLRALLDSWVQIRDAEDSLLLTRVLQPGDTYRVPELSGLTLLTGNAGGLQIEVDGAAVPPLGPVGAVRRNIALDPERLLDGTAAAQ